MSRAFELVATIDRALLAASDASGANTLETLKGAVITRKRELANEFVGISLGQSYDWFFTCGKERLPVEVYSKMLYDIGQIGLQCSVIVVLPWEGRLAIFRINDDGQVEYCENFCAIGTGLYIAESMLFYREHMARTKLSKALYHAFEAAYMGSFAPGVGDRVSCAVVHWGKNGFTLKELTQFHQDYLVEKIREYAPAPVGRLRMWPNSLEDFTDQD